MKRIRKRLTYANVISTLALFLVIGGASAFAASHLGKNSVGSKQLKKNAVTSKKIKNNAVTGGKIKDGSITTTKIANDAVTGAQINESTLGTVPSASTAGTANLANSIPPAEPTHLVGTPGQPAFEDGSSNLVLPPEAGVKFNPVGFYKDHEGIVHLEGVAQTGNAGSPETIFTLPPGYRPAPGTLIVLETTNEVQLIIAGSNSVLNTGTETIDLSGQLVSGEEKQVILDGITYRAGS